MTSDLYYQHSGKFSVGGMIIGLVLGSVIGVVLAFPYAYMILYIPFIYINAFITGGFGAIVGALAAQSLKWQKTRNTGVAVAVSFLVLLISYYACWGVWIYGFLRRADVKVGLLTILLDPEGLWKVINLVNQTGAWNIRGLVPKGVFLWGFWSIEALIIFGAGLFSAMGMMSSDAFCERCGVWCEGKEKLARVASGEEAELKQRMESKDIGHLEKLGAVKDEAMAWYRVDMSSCPQCHMTNTLTVQSVTVTVDKEGKKSENEKVVVDRLLIDSSEADRIRAMAEKLAPATPAAAPGT